MRGVFIYKQKNPIYRGLSSLVVIVLSFSLAFSPPASYAQSVNFFNLPVPGTMVPLSPVFSPAVIKGVKIFPDNPLRFDFIVSKADSGLEGDGLKQESEKLIKYFLASLTVPENDLWVNLSPDEQDRIIPEGFGRTEMGRDLLAQDYLLKQIAASLMYPEDDLGKKFWAKIYKEAYQRFGTTEVPVDTFNKVWIVPEKAVVYENGDTVYIVESRLKVMLDSDYEAMQHAKNMEEGREKIEEKLSDQHPSSNFNLQSSLIKEIILPEIEREVNEGAHFTQLRQIYHSMILATWYKRNLRKSILNKIYVDKNKVDGINVQEADVIQKIYDRYIESFKRGVYNYIKEDYDPNTQEHIPRKYFSGGVNVTALGSSSILQTVNQVPAGAILSNTDNVIISSLVVPEQLRERIPGSVPSVSSPVSEDTGRGVADVWKILVEDGFAREIYTLRAAKPGVDRRAAMREKMKAILEGPAVKEKFVARETTRMKGVSEEGPGLESSRSRAEATWAVVSEALTGYKEIYFEDDHVDIFYKKGPKDQSIVRIAPDHFVDYLTDTLKLRSFFGHGLRVDVLTDAREVADMHNDLAFYKSHPEFYQLVYDLDSNDERKISDALERLEDLAYTGDLGDEARRLLTAALGLENGYVQRKVQEVLNNLYSGRPQEMPRARRVQIANTGEKVNIEDVVMPVGFNTLRQKHQLSQMEARLVVATNSSDQLGYRHLDVRAESDDTVRLSLSEGVHAVRAGRGVIHTAVQVRRGPQEEWTYVHVPEANTLTFVQPDMRGKRIYQAWPAYLGVYGEDGKVQYDEDGRAIPGNFETIEKMLPELSKRGFTHIYVMGVYQLDRPENIIGQEGPDASLFSPLKFSISQELGGEEGLQKLKTAAKDTYGIDILVDLIPHVNQNFKDLPEWAIVKARANDGRIIRRSATDGSINHEDGTPVEWRDSVVINWRDTRILKAYLDLLRRLAQSGIKGARLDVAHNWGTLLPTDGGLTSKQKLFGQITSWARNAEGGFKVVNELDGQQGNPILTYLVAEVSKEYPDFIFIGENYGRDIQLIKSGTLPMETGTYSDLKKVVIDGGSTQRILNGHFRWLFNNLPQGAQLVGALETHDFFRVMDRWEHYGPFRLKAAIWTWLATTRGPILLFNRQEEGEVHRIRIDNYTRHNYDEADRQRYYAQLDFERAHGERVQDFYDRAVGFYGRHEALYRGENYIIDTNHDRIFAIARYNQKENFIFVINEWWETAFVEVNLKPLLEHLKINPVRHQFYVVTNHETMKEEIFTGAELAAEGIQLKLGAYEPAVLSIRPLRQPVNGAIQPAGIRPKDHNNHFKKRALMDGLRRYNGQYKPRRTEVNFAFTWLEQGVMAKGYKMFIDRFAYLAHLAEGAERPAGIQVSDLTVLLHDLANKHPDKRQKIKKMFVQLIKHTEDDIAKAVAVKVLRWMDVGVVVFVSPEAGPFFKAGGMANVVGDLAAVLEKLGLKMYVVVPLYQNFGDQRKRKEGIEYTGKIAQVYMGRHGMAPAAIARTRRNGVEYVFLDNPNYADALYGQASKEHEALRAQFLSLGALEAMKMLNIHPAIVAGHDWMLAPLMAHLNSEHSPYKKDPHFSETKTVSWVHNNGQDYQFKLERLQDGIDLLANLGLPSEDFGWFTDPHNGTLVNFMSAHIRHSKMSVAVSPGQLQDYIGTDDKGGGEGFRAIFDARARERRLFSLTNGISLRERQRKWFDGMSMFDVHSQEDMEKFLRITEEKNHESKRIIANERPEFWPASGGRSAFVNEDHFVVNMISRITEQKGIHFVAPFIRRVLESGRYPDVSFVLGGAGDPRLMGELSKLVYDFPGRVGYPNGFISDQDPTGIYYHAYRAGDLFIAFSTWEPGGISPMEALAFGVPALVSDKQGHKSTVKTIFIPEFAQAFGISHDETSFNGARFPIDSYGVGPTVNNIMIAFDRMYNMWKARKTDDKWQTLRRNALTSNNSWEETAKVAEALFKFTLGHQEYHPILAEASLLTGKKSGVVSSPISPSDDAEKNARVFSDKIIEEGRIGFLMIKPDGQPFKDEILRMLAEEGMEIVLQKERTQVPKPILEQFYKIYEKEDFYHPLVDHAHSGDLTLLILSSEQKGVLKRVQELSQKIHEVFRIEEEVVTVQDEITREVKQVALRKNKVDVPYSKKIILDDIRVMFTQEELASVFTPEAVKILLPIEAAKPSSVKKKKDPSSGGAGPSTTKDPGASSPVQDTKGGIDLTPAGLNLQTTGQGMDVDFDFSSIGLPCLDRSGNGSCHQLDAEALENMDIKGFVPVIFQVVPVTNLPLFLGLDDEDKRDDFPAISHYTAPQPMDRRVLFLKTS